MTMNASGIAPSDMELRRETLETRIRQFHELSNMSTVTSAIWFGLSLNPSITMRDVLDHPDKPWSVEDLAANPYVVRPMTDEIVDYVRKRYAAFVISSAAYEAWTNPNSYLCKRRLQREFDMLT